MLFVIVLSMLMILLPALSVLRHLICKTLWIGRGSGLLIAILEKLNWFRLTCLITLVLLMWKWMGLFLEKSSFKMFGLSSSSKFYWESYNISIAKTASKKHGGFYSFPEVSFSIVCSVSLWIYHMVLHGWLLSCLGWWS